MKLTALAGSMVSNGRHIIIGRVGKCCAQSSPTSALNGKDQDLRPCFLSIKLRQGRSLSLPTLPYQRTNRYAVDGAKLVFHLLHPRIGYPNHYAAIGAIQAFYLLRSRISHTNSYVVVGTTPLICAWVVMSCLLSRISYIIRCVAVWKEMVFVGRTSNTKLG